MLFNSYLFVLVFLPAVLAGYFTLNRLGKYTLAQVFLLGMSCWFYGYAAPRYLALLAASIAVNYLAVGAMGKWRRLRRYLAAAAIAVDLGLLFYFKYHDFFAENLNRFLGTDLALLNIALPLGISFFTFSQIGYVVDACRGDFRDHTLLNYACFVACFPLVLSGPIVTHDELMPQLSDPARKRFSWDNFAAGLYLFALGLGKKVLIADVFGRIADWGFGSVLELDATNALAVTLAYTFQLYFDFSGYSDMSIGIGRMLNLDLPVNFDSPYKALTITDFWKRWHKTLTRFLTKYIYIPLGGSRRGKARTYVNVMIVFLVSGLWHGAAYTFVLWGLLHGLFSVVTRHWKGWFERLHPALSWLLTFGFVSLSFALFRAGTVTDFLNLFKALLHMEFGPLRAELLQALRLPEIDALIRFLPGAVYLEYYPGLLAGLFYGGALAAVLGAKNAGERAAAFRPDGKRLLWTAVLLAWCVMSFSGVSTFLYFDF